MPFTPDFVRVLERLHLTVRRRMTGEGPGVRRSDKRGASIEFHDYRRYAPGDEVRYVDWNVYARHGSLFIKEFSAEERIHVRLLLDASDSMSFGDPSKLQAARETAAALGYVGLLHYDSVSVRSFPRLSLPERGPLRGKGRLFELLERLDAVQPRGAGNLADISSSLDSSGNRGRSLVLVLTDAYDPSLAEAIRSLRAPGREVHLVHFISREEIEPTGRGNLLFTELETGASRRFRVTDSTIRRYRERFMAWCGEVERLCRANELGYIRVRSDRSLEERVMEIFRKGGMIELR